MKQNHFGRRSSASRSLGLLAACAMSAASGGCRLELSDGRAGGSGGDSPADVTKTEDGGATTGSGGASTANAGAPSTAHGGANGATQAGSANAGSAPSGGASSSAIFHEDCASPIANDDREHAVDFGAGATVCPTEGDDWFYLDTPSDGRAHVIEFEISETVDSWININVTAEKDGSGMGTIHPSQRGLKLNAFVTVGPGTRTWFDVKGYANNSGSTTIKVSVTAEADDHEPNNDRASATLIQPATEISAQLIVPYVSETDQQVQDWYKVELAAGDHTFHLTGVPSDSYPRIALIDSTNAVLLSNQGAPNRGATFDFRFSLDEAGSYYFQIGCYCNLDIVYSGTKADSFTQPYKFRID